MTNKEATYTIQNIGGIADLTMTLRHGVNVLKGPNGAGKTTALEAVSRSTGGKGVVERRDGVAKGTVTGPGVRLNVTGVVRTAKAGEGEAALSLAEVSPLSRLIDPQMVGDEEAARARVKALVELLGLVVDDDSVAQLCQGDKLALAWFHEKISEEGIEDLIVAADALRLHFQAHARHQERTIEGEAAVASSAQQDGSEAMAKLSELMPDETVVRPIEMTMAEAQAAVVTASSDARIVKSLFEDRVELRRRQDEIRESIGDQPDCTSAAAELQEAEYELELVDRQVEDAMAELARLRAVKSDAHTRARLAGVQLRGREEEHRRWEELRAILDKDSEGGPSLRDVTKAEELTKQATTQVEIARYSDDWRESQDKRLAAESRRHEAQQEASRLRGASAAITSRLGEILSKSGSKTLRVTDGRIYAMRDGTAYDFATRCSTGQRALAALEVWESVAGEDAIGALDWRIWASLDPHSRSEVARWAVENDLYILTEEPSDGELRIEHVE